jgi:hypothetical protein
MKTSLIDKVRDRLADESSKLSTQESALDKAIKLSDIYSDVKPEEYKLPLTLSIGAIR